MEIYFVTSNKNKLKEFEEILGFKLKNISLDLKEIQSIDAKEVVIYKAKEAFKIIKKPVIVEDSALYFEAWNGLPGALIKLFESKIGYKTLCKILGKNRKAKAQTVIGYFDGRNYKNFIGEIEGKISFKPKGKNGFGWDVIFIPKGHQKTFAQMSQKEKNEISMRKIALERFKEFCKRIGSNNEE